MAATKTVYHSIWKLRSFRSARGRCSPKADISFKWKPSTERSNDPFPLSHGQWPRIHIQVEDICVRGNSQLCRKHFFQEASSLRAQPPISESGACTPLPSPARRQNQKAEQKRLRSKGAKDLGQSNPRACGTRWPAKSSQLSHQNAKLGILQSGKQYLDMAFLLAWR